MIPLPAASGTAPSAPDTPPLQAPTLRRRLAAMLYEGIVLFGVVALAGLLYAVASQQRHALQGRHGLLAFVAVVLGLYFVWFWSHGGQTVAMKTWHVRVVDRHGQPVTWLRALCRFVACWVWFLPVILLWYAAQWPVTWALFGALATGVLAYAATAWLHPQRQFWHDALCGTRLVQTKGTATSGGHNGRP
jgi:uncharacterized RDD family membrane protein YckC